MCFYEDRMQAIALCIKLGKCAKATIRQLGYPSEFVIGHQYRGPSVNGYWRTIER